MKKLADRSKEVIVHKKTLFGTVGRWPWPLNRGGHLMEVVSLLIYNKYSRDFDNWPLNGGRLIEVQLYFCLLLRKFAPHPSHLQMMA